MLIVLALLLARPTLEPLALPLTPYLRYQSTLQATINGVSGTFLFDTGEGVTAISSAFARRLGCKPWGKITGLRMTGAVLGSAHCDNLEMVLHGRAFALPSAIALDVGALMGAGVPPIDGAIGLDVFDHQILTIEPRRRIVLETNDSLIERTVSAIPLPIRIVRDAEGVALSIDAAVSTPEGVAWMELDSGNGGSIVVDNAIAPLLGIPRNMAVAAPYTFSLLNKVSISEPVRSRDLIMDGDIGARFLNNWNLTIDLINGRAWIAPANS